MAETDNAQAPEGAVTAEMLFDALNAASVELGEGPVMREHVSDTSWTGLRSTASHLSARIASPSEGVLAEVVAERARQIAKGYDAASDDQHTDRVLATEAARSLDCTGLLQDVFRKRWHPWINPDAPYRDRLVSAAALVIAEIERTDRALGGQS